MTGTELRDLRLRLGYSLSQLADAMGLDVSTVCRYQSGSHRIPRSVELALKTLRPKQTVVKASVNDTK